MKGKHYLSSEPIREFLEGGGRECEKHRRRTNRNDVGKSEK